MTLLDSLKKFTTVVADTGDIESMRAFKDRKSTRLNSSHVETSYAVFCLKKKKGPTPEPAGASAGGTITVHLPDAPGPDDLDPPNGCSRTRTPNQQALPPRTPPPPPRSND